MGSLASVSVNRDPSNLEPWMSIFEMDIFPESSEVHEDTRVRLSIGRFNLRDVCCLRALRKVCGWKKMSRLIGVVKKEPLETIVLVCRMAVAFLIVLSI